MIKLTCPRHEELFIREKDIALIREEDCKFRCPLCNANSITCLVPDFTQKRNKNPIYLEWIRRRFPDSFSARHRCHEASLEMQAVFSELRLQRGLYNYSEHWWLITPTNEIVDPTLIQFRDKNGWYVIHKEGTPEPLGICYGCSSYVWEKDYKGMCSEECLKEVEMEYSRSF